MGEHVSITEELRARIEELTRERDGLKHREDLLKIANEQLLHVNKSVARHGIITESVRRLTDLLGIDDDATNPTANETTDAAAEAIERLTRERDAANAKHETLSALVDGYRRERYEAREELESLRIFYHGCEIDRRRIACELDEARADAANAYRRGAEAMREACQQWCRAWENNGEAIADALADLRVEGKP